MDLYVSREGILEGRYSILELMKILYTHISGRIRWTWWNLFGINEEKMQYYARNSIDILSSSLYTFYKLLFSTDGEVILTKFSDRNMDRDSDLSNYYDLEYSETESELSSSETWGSLQSIFWFENRIISELPDISNRDLTLWTSQSEVMIISSEEVPPQFVWQITW